MTILLSVLVVGFENHNQLNAARFLNPEKGKVETPTPEDRPNISFYNNYMAYPVAKGKPLFTKGGVNKDVANELKSIIAQTESRTTPATYGETYVEQNADHFSQWVGRFYNGGTLPSDWATDEVFEDPRAEWIDGPPNTNMGINKSGGVFIKLFDISVLTGLTEEQRSLANSWFQVVYCAGANITFWMAEPYRTARFHSTETSPGYRDSEIRTVTLKNDYDAIRDQLGAFLDTAIVTPVDNALSGDWQSNEFQTGTDVLGQTIIGASGSIRAYSDRFPRYCSDNGMNPSGTYMLYGNKLWLPSAFEIGFMGHDKELRNANNSANFGIIAEQDNPDSNLLYSYGRLGLWRLTPYDRACDEVIINGRSIYDYSWLRSMSVTNSVEPGIDYYLGQASSIYGWYPLDQWGVRPALHIRIWEL